jgi:hypothetical protein
MEHDKCTAAVLDLSSNGGTDGEIEHEDGWCDLHSISFLGRLLSFLWVLGFSFLFCFSVLFRASISLFRFKVTFS